MRRLRARIAFLVLPGVVAGLIPAVITARTKSRADALLPAIAMLAAGSGLLRWGIRDFFVIGRGTLAPWDPPRRLVVAGAYRFVRNPIHLAVLAIAAGWSLLFVSGGLALYTGFLAAAFHLRVTGTEEPRLRGQFGAAWDANAAATPRWLPRLGRRKGS